MPDVPVAPSQRRGPRLRRHPGVTAWRRWRMRLVGTQPLGATRVTGAVVVPPVGDLAAVVRPRVRTLVHALARVALFALRTCRPVVDGFVAVLRIRPVVPLAGSARVAATPPESGPPLVAQAAMA